VDEQPAGRIWISRGAEIHLLDIALLGEFQNRGVGTVLLRGLIDEAVRVQKPLRHTVFVLNTQAKQFYERLGFVVFGEAGAYLHMEWRGPRIDDCQLAPTDRSQSKISNPQSPIETTHCWRT
jgi:GNAT superfamily N-acetyltransferase